MEINSAVYICWSYLEIFLPGEKDDFTPDGKKKNWMLLKNVTGVTEFRVLGHYGLW